MIPVFLQKYAEKVLFAGKYLNVIRECGKDVKNPCEDDIVFSNTSISELSTSGSSASSSL
jgi:hypothetical protein